MNTRLINTGEQAASCYFRTSVEKPHRKALIQIDERCNLHCVHCFVSATRRGSSMPLAAVENILVPRLSECRVRRVTLTGGEPTPTSLAWFAPFAGPRWMSASARTAPIWTTTASPSWSGWAGCT